MSFFSLATLATVQSTRFGRRLTSYWHGGGRLGCASHSEKPHAPEENIKVRKQSPGPEMPAGPRRPYVVCNYRTTRGECFDTAEEACASIDCPREQCGSPYGGG